MSKKITQIEVFGFERIPNESRYARPMDVFRLLFGGCNTFSTSVLGSIPIFLGLSLEAGAWAITLGVLTGSALLAPMSLFGPRTGTSDPVSSGAHFGIHGRLVGSFLALLTAITFFSLAVWSSGDALVGGLHNIVGVPVTGAALGIAYALFAGIVLSVCVFGFRLMLLVNKIAVWAASLLFIVGLVAFSNVLDLNYVGTLQYGSAGFLPAFAGAMIVALSNPLSFASTLGDWARYIPERTPSHRMICSVLAAQVATLIPFFFGLGTAAIIATKAPRYIASNDYIGGLLAISPQWFFLPVCLIAIVGGMSTGTTALYGTGLDVSSMFPKILNRVRATILIGGLAIVFIFFGRFVLNLIESVSLFSILISTFSASWVVVMIIGFVKRRGFYLSDDLQVFNYGKRGGRYWFTHGWNFRALGAWLPSSMLGLSFVSLPGQFVGPLAYLADGIDISVLVSATTSGLLYVAWLWLFPESDAVQAPVDASFIQRGPGAVTLECSLATGGPRISSSE